MREVPAHARQPAAVSNLLEIPALLAEERQVSELHLRAFGTRVEDLDVDFSSEDSGELATELLVRCSAGAPSAIAETDWYRRLPVGTRLRGLVQLCLLGGIEDFAWTVTCAADGCGEMVDVELPLLVLAAPSPAASAGVIEVSSDGENLRVRLPTEEDIAEWRQSDAGPDDMLRALVQGNWSQAMSADLLDAVEAALIEADPLVGFDVICQCPGCGSSLALDVDVEAEALGTLKRLQEELFEEISMLASVFHWSESDIVRLPRERRRRYITQIEKGIR